jgi:hypothetical protein
MACGVIGRDLIVRVGPQAYQAALAEAHVRPFHLTAGRPARGWVLVDQTGLQRPATLAKWVGRGVDFARSLPAK